MLKVRRQYISYIFSSTSTRTKYRYCHKIDLRMDLVKKQAACSRLVDYDYSISSSCRYLFVLIAITFWLRLQRWAADCAHVR